jgi:hypothetical protein
MDIALIIVGGIVLTTITASLFDYLGKRKRGGDPETAGRITAVEQRLSAAEAKLGERDERIAQLENDLGFVTRLIEDKTK